MTRGRLLLIVLLAAAAGSGHARTPTQAPQTPPRFESRVEVGLVTVDITVVDGDGRPVPGLTAGDFVVRVDGQPRAIVSLQFVEQHPPAEAVPDAPPPLASSNETTGHGRLIAFVIDQGNIRAGGGRAALRAAERFLDTLTPADRVAVFAVPPPGPRVPFTDDVDRVREALRRTAGQASPFEGNRYRITASEALAIVDGDRRTLMDVAARECRADDPACEDGVESDAQSVATDIRLRARASISGIEAALADLLTVKGPKTVVLISEGLTTERSVSDVSSIGRLAAQAQATLYAMRLSSAAFDASDGRAPVSTGADARLQVEGLETIAGVAKGAVFNVAGSGDGVFARVAREISGYYLLAFEPQPGDRDGRAHQIRVDVRRDRVTVRARREFRVADAAAAGPSDGDALSGALGSPLVIGDVPIRLSTYNFRDPDSSKIRLYIAAEIGRGLKAADERALAFALFDRQGRVIDSGMQRKTLFPRDGASPSPLVYDGTLIVNPGEYVLKLAVVDAEGRLGTVERAVHARLHDVGALRAGDLVVGPRGRGARMLRPPTDARVADRAFSFIELYGQRESDFDAVAVDIEVAEAADGPALVSGAAPYAAVQARLERQAFTELDLGVLPPGRYVARARITIDNRPAGVVTRPFEVEAPAAAAGAAETPPAPAVRPGGTLDASAFVDPFSRDELFRPEIVGAFLDEVVGALPLGPMPPRLEEARAEARQGQIGRAADTAKSETLHPLTTFLRGLAMLEKGDIETAASFFRSTLQSAPGAYAPMVYLAACYAAGGRDDEAAGAWQTSLAGLDDSPLVFQLLADAAMRAGDGRTAVDTLQEALDAWPDDPRFSRRFGTALLLFGRSREGLAALDRHLDRHPDDERAWLLGVQAVYGLRAAGRGVDTPQEDLARARRYADGYARLGGGQQPLVRRWLAYLEGQIDKR